MNNYTVINKGSFTLPAISNFVTLKQHIFIKEGGRNFLILKLANGRSERMTGITLEIVQKNSRGVNIGLIKQYYNVLNGKPSGEFVLDYKIALSDDCTDFSVRIVSADYDNYTYTNSENDVLTLTYNDGTEQGLASYVPKKNFRGGASQAVSTKNYRVNVTACIFVMLILAFAMLFTYGQLMLFVDDASTFYYMGVEYEFENGDKSSDSNVIVIGTEPRVSNITIPQKIKNHNVVRIANFAFFQNVDLKKVTIKGETVIGEYAFSSCSNLEQVSIDKVTKIEEYAFLNCSSIKEISASNLQSIASYAFYNCSGLKSVNIFNNSSVLTLGKSPFFSCVGLENVKINQYIDYPESLDLFLGSNNIKNLHLKNLNYDFTFGGEYYEGKIDTTIHQLFGFTHSNSTALNALNSLTIDFMYDIPFSFCRNLTLQEATFNNIISYEVGSYAFANCTKLRTLTTAFSFVRVGESAFSKTAIESFDGNRLTTLGNYAFADCQQLLDFSLGQNTLLKAFGIGVFSGCERLRSFYIPTAITKIPNNLFYNCKRLTRVSYSGNIVDIGNEAFKGCSMLASAPTENAEFIGDGAFSGCTDLESASFSDKLKAIGTNAFLDCSSLVSVELGESVESIGMSAFAGTSALTEITVPFIGGTNSSNKYFSYIFGASSYSQNDIVPTSLKRITIISADVIGNNAFENVTSVTEIKILSDYSSIGSSAFKNCNNLNNFVIPSSVTQIGLSAFEGCYRLFELYNLSEMGILRGATNNGMAGYYTIVIYPTLTSPKAASFTSDNFEFLQDDISVWYATKYKGTNVNVKFPVNPYYKGNIIYNIVSYMMFDNQTIESVTISESVNEIGENAFKNCSALKIVDIDNNVVQIGFGAFENCNELSGIKLPFVGKTRQDNNYFSHIFGGSNYASYSKIPSKLSRVTLTDISALAPNAFYNCYNISDVFLGEQCVEIGNDAFYGCSSLKNISLSSQLTSIGNRAFYDCASLENIELTGERLLEIGMRAFAGCMALKSFEIRNNFTNIGLGALENCYSLTEITIPRIGNEQYAFFAYIFGSVSYFASSVPSALKTVTIISSGIVPDYAFYNCHSLEIFNMVATSIGKYAFFQNYNLTSIDLSYAETIGEFAFVSCNSLKNISLSNKLSKLSDSVFSQCGALSEIILPASIQTIDQSAFSFCTSLQRLTLNSKAEINYDAFYNCTSLFEIYNLANANLTIGETDNGYIAFYAMFIHSSIYDEAMEEVVMNNIIYKKSGNNWVLYRYIGNEQSLTLSSFVHNDMEVSSYSIYREAFLGNYELKKLTIRSQVKSIGMAAFQHCSNLESVIFENSPITTLNNNVFSGCGALKSVELPQMLEIIGEYAFYNCRNLLTIKIPEKVKTIGSDAFLQCYSLVDIANLSSLPISKGSYEHGCVAFYALRVMNRVLTSLTFAEQDGFVFVSYNGDWYLLSTSNYSGNLYLPESFMYLDDEIESYILLERIIAYKQFYNIYIPSSVKKIHDESFDFWSDLRWIYYHGTNDDWKELVDGIENSLFTFTSVIFNATW